MLHRLYHNFNHRLYHNFNHRLYHNFNHRLYIIFCRCHWDVNWSVINNKFINFLVCCLWSFSTFPIIVVVFDKHNSCVFGIGYFSFILILERCINELFSCFTDTGISNTYKSCSSGPDGEMFTLSVRRSFMRRRALFPVQIRYACQFISFQYIIRVRQAKLWH